MITNGCLYCLDREASRLGIRPVIDGVSSQLNPAVLREYLYESESWDIDSVYLLDGVINGFRLLDKSAVIAPYQMANYGSCFFEGAYASLNKLILEEVQAGKLSVVEKQPNCVHALGALSKSRGGIRPITDCSRPRDLSVNHHTSETFSTFSFVKMWEILQNVSQDIYMATVDLKSAYRSVLIHPSNRTYFGLT